VSDTGDFKEAAKDYATAAGAASLIEKETDERRTSNIERPTSNIEFCLF